MSLFHNEKVSDQRMYLSPVCIQKSTNKDVIITLTMLTFCLWHCSDVNICGAHPPPPLPYDGAEGPRQKNGLFLLNVGGDLVSFLGTDW